MVWAAKDILQLGYVCKNLEQGIQYFIDKQGAGPFYRFDIPADAVACTYRGQSIPPVGSRVAFGYRGPLQFELFETGNVLYNHILGNKAIAYHHCIQMSDQFQDDIDQYAKAGFETLGIANMPGVLIHYIDTWDAIGHYTEVFDYNNAIVETDGAMFKLFEIMHKAALTWDGQDPVRPMPELPA